MKPSPEQGGGWVKPTFSEISKGCPWRDGLRCLILCLVKKHETYGEANCAAHRCAVFYWIKEGL